MSGQQQSKTDDEQIQNKLTELIDSIALSDTKRFVNEQSKTALYLNHQQIKSMHRDDLVEAAFILRQYALNITLDINRYSSIINWSQAKLNDQISKSGLEDIYQYELKVAAVIRENNYAKKLHNVIQYNKAYKEQLNNVSFSIGKMADTLENLARGKDYAKGRY